MSTPWPSPTTAPWCSPCRNTRVERTGSGPGDGDGLPGEGGVAGRVGLDRLALGGGQLHREDRDHGDPGTADLPPPPADDLGVEDDRVDRLVRVVGGDLP